MDDFVENTCIHNNCGRIFDNLSHLINHIQLEHIDFHPKTIKAEKAAAPPKSNYTCRFCGRHAVPPLFISEIKMEPIEELKNEGVEPKLVRRNNKSLNLRIKKEKVEPDKSFYNLRGRCQKSGVLRC